MELYGVKHKNIKISCFVFEIDFRYLWVGHIFFAVRMGTLVLYYMTS